MAFIPSAELNKNNFAIGIQCRSNSSRLPGKCFLPFNGGPMWLSVYKTALSTGIDTYMLIPDNDPTLQASLAENNVPENMVVLGPEASPLDRFIELRDKKMRIDQNFIIRLTADCPLIAPWMILDCAYHFFEDRAIFIYNDMDGIDIQIAHITLFNYKIYTDREHVFNMSTIKSDRLDTAYMMRLSIDQKWQYDHIVNILEAGKQ